MKKILNLATISLLAIFLFSCAGDDKKPAFNLEGTEWFTEGSTTEKGVSLVFTKDYAEFYHKIQVTLGGKKITAIQQHFQIFYTYDAKSKKLTFTKKVKMFGNNDTQSAIYENYEILGKKTGDTSSGGNLFFAIVVNGEEYIKAPYEYAIDENTKIISFITSETRLVKHDLKRAK